jgi:hypothetical protein
VNDPWLIAAVADVAPKVSSMHSQPSWLLALASK